MQWKRCRAEKFVTDTVSWPPFVLRPLWPRSIAAAVVVAVVGLANGSAWAILDCFSLTPSTVFSLAFSHQHQTSPAAYVRTREPPARSRTHTILLLSYTYVYGVRAYVWRSIVRACSSFSLNRSRWSTRAPPPN